MLYDYEFYVATDRTTPVVILSAPAPLTHVAKGNRLFLDTQVHGTKLGWSREVQDIVVALHAVSGGTPTRVKTMVFLGPEERIP